MDEALLRMAERIARLSTWRVDLPGLQAWSDEVHAIRDLPAGFVPILDSALEAYVPEDRPRLRAAVDACVQHGQPFDLELRLNTAAGRLIWARVIAEAVRGSGGGICRIEGVIQDVTERRTAEDEARRLATVVTDTLEHISDGFVTIDRDWRFTFFNREGERQVGQPRHELIGRNMWEVYPEMLGTIFESSYRHAMATQQMVEFEAWFEPLQAWFNIRAYPSPQGLAIYFFNVTQQHESRELVRISEERFRLLARATSDAIWDVDLTANVTWRNEGFHTLFGYDVSDTAAQDDWAARIHPDDRQRVTDSVMAALEGSGNSWSDEYRFLRKDGGVAHVIDRGYIIRDGLGRPLRMVGGMSDVTERKKLESQFLRTQRLESIGTLAGGIAHDLNNVLAPILMSVGLLREEETDPDRITLLDTIETSGRRGSDMVRQVLSFARGVEGKRVAVNIRHLFSDVQKIIRDAIPKNIDVVFTAPADTWVINADATQIHQVIMNLCVNARDAMPEGGVLRVEAGNLMLDEIYTGQLGALYPGPHLTIKVSDTGIGMSRDTLERVFEPFFTTKELGKGTGLGLSTVLTIVKSHGGAIDIQSELGAGTTFVVLLPAEVGVAAGATAEQAPLPQGNQELVMIVDDEEHIRTLTTRTLERYNYRVLEARHGAEAVALYAQHRDVALVITDMAMPVMDGSATITALKSIHPMLRVIASSGHSSQDAHQRAITAGADTFINKPYTLEDLVRTVHHVLAAPAGSLGTPRGEV